MHTEHRQYFNNGFQWALMLYVHVYVSIANVVVARASAAYIECIDYI